ncbi:MAG TPA: hypothetical protein VIG33_15000 [Pseudobdellovibrionaceae bacterium]|jgi:hypothetical protein
MKNLIFLSLMTIVSATNAQAATQSIYVEGHSPVGSFISSLRGQSATIEGLLIQKAKEICASDSSFSISNLQVSISSRGGRLNLNGERDTLDHQNLALSLGQPHSTYSAYIHCDQPF